MVLSVMLLGCADTKQKLGYEDENGSERGSRSRARNVHMSRETLSSTRTHPAARVVAIEL